LEGAFLGSSKKGTTYHPPELGYLEQELLPLVGDLLDSGRDRRQRARAHLSAPLAALCRSQLGVVKLLADAACLTDAGLPENYRVTADHIEQRRHLKSLNPELFVHCSLPRAFWADISGHFWTQSNINRLPELILI
jgi:hypothetical protein